MSLSLMTSRRFAPLFWTQFFSAFNDNFLKNALVFLILFKIGGPDAEILIMLAGAIFIAPFFFLSGLGGQLADRFDKAMVAQRLKLAEIGAAAIAVAGFAMHSLPLLFRGALPCSARSQRSSARSNTASCPTTSQREELPAGNALVEGATFMAILLGTIAGGIAAKGGGSPTSFGALIILFALLCWGASLKIPATGQAAPDLRVDANIARSTVALLKHLWSDPRLRWGGLVVSWFWLVGAVVLSLLPPLVKDHARRRRGDRHRLSRNLLRRRRGRLRPRRLARARPHHSLADADRRGPPRSLLARSRLGGVRRRTSRQPRPALEPCSPRCSAIASRSTSPASRLPAASSSCRPLPPFRFGPAPTGARASSQRST